MSNIPTSDRRQEDEIVAEQFEGLDNDLMDVGKVTDGPAEVSQTDEGGGKPRDENTTP
ncbi:hypothetical protein [Aureimonas ureilytica]|uniref:hypothetical protein n=1 Tax=Aureimonas ureilytica TaxID=401562 RepID=UPI0003823F95|nr:hypothetical protein [Aureimonas ureilytica]